MQYLYHPDSSSPLLELREDSHRYIFKIRRHRVGEMVKLRNLEDDKLYSYVIKNIDKQKTVLSLKDSELSIVESEKKLHVCWCIVDPKSIEKILPTLNEIGVDKITFVYCERSQRSFKLDFSRLEKIILNSSQQSGRSRLMKLETVESLEVFVSKHPNSKLLNFSEHNFISDMDIDTIIVGCEGGFCPDEVALFDPSHIVGLRTSLVLRAESAVAVIASKILL
ncbi:MAG: 16S rRNA (uracil(1498)-N(3))-methyltransferase [Sulfurovum sp.]|nr:16S rRNA (uracil(1498)-N(3))-methyltransferase [Sulfurovum sp.]